MHTITLPGISRPLSRICLGTGLHGSAIAEDDAFALLDDFAAGGGTFLDTAHIYAAWLPGGTGASERTIGRWLTRRSLQGRMVIASKGGHPPIGSPLPARLAPAEIAADCRESRERLAIDRIDIYWLHRDDPLVPVDEILGVLDELRRSGAIGAIGVSNWTTTRLAEANHAAMRLGIPGFVASQIGWSLADADPTRIPPGGMLYMDETTLAWHRRNRLRVIPYSSQACGFFSDKRSPSLYDSPRNQLRRTRVRELAASRGVSPTALALAWMLAHPCAGSAIIGSRTREQLADSLAADALILSDQELRHLEG